MLISIPSDQLVRAPYAEVRASAADRTAVSKPAHSMRDAALSAASWLEASVWFFGNRASLISELAQIQHECAASNWDGAGARPVSEFSIARSVSFVRALPRGLQNPDVAPAPDGSVTFEWTIGRHRRFMVSIAGSDRIAYAWLDGTDSGHAVARFSGASLPRQVKETMRAVGVKRRA